MTDNGPLVWVDCEMTGLDAMNDHIIEVCCLLTDGDLNIIEEKGFEAVIHYPKDVMDKMNPWCINTHGKSGLTEKVLNSTNTLASVEESFLEYLKKHISRKGTGVLAGNSVHQDRYFMLREFPKVIDFLHYRQVDVSSIKEVGKRHNPRLMMDVLPKKQTHTARSDIEESIAELKWYYDNYLIGPKKPASAGNTE